MACDTYDLAEDRIKAFSRSSVRAKIMLCLTDGPKTAAEMEKSIGTRVSTILHAVKEMNSEDLIIKASRGYALTNIGLIQARVLEELINTIVTLDRHKEFWLTHDISGIPVGLQRKIGMLGISEVLKGDPAAILKTQEFFISELKKSKEIHGVSPIIVPGYSEAIAVAVGNGAQVDLILTSNILSIVLKEYREMIQDLLFCENFRLYRINDNITVAFTVTDSILSLGLFRIEGGYDVASDLNCLGPEAKTWGMELFAHYLSLSERITNV